LGTSNHSHILLPQTTQTVQLITAEEYLLVRICLMDWPNGVLTLPLNSTNQCVLQEFSNADSVVVVIFGETPFNVGSEKNLFRYFRNYD
jgi:hypothetical protein